MPRKNKKKFYLGVIAGFVVSLLVVGGGLYFVSNTAFAQVNTSANLGTTFGLGTADLLSTVIKIVQWVLGLLGLVAVIVIMYGGFVWMTAGGNPDKIDKAKKILIRAVIGLIIILLAWAITLFVMNQIQKATGGGGAGGPGVPPTHFDPHFTWNKATTSRDGADPNQDVHLCSKIQSTFNASIRKTTVDANNQGTCMPSGSGACTNDLNCTTAGDACVFTNAHLRVIDTATGNVVYADPADGQPGGGIWAVRNDTLSFGLPKNQGQPVLWLGNHDYELQVPNDGATVPATPLRDTSGLTLYRLKTGVTYLGGTLAQGYFTFPFHVGTTLDNTKPSLVSAYPRFTPPPDRSVNRTPVLRFAFTEDIDITSITDTNGHPTGGTCNGGPDNGNYCDATTACGAPGVCESHFILNRLAGQGGSVVNPDGTPGSTPYDNAKLEVSADDVNHGFLIRIIDPGTDKLESFTWYRLTVRGIEDLCGNAMNDIAPWEFETTNVEPGIDWVRPKENATNVCPTASITVKFKTSMYFNDVRFNITGGGLNIQNLHITPRSDGSSVWTNIGTGPGNPMVYLDVINPGDQSTGYTLFRVHGTNFRLPGNNDISVQLLTDFRINETTNLTKNWGFHVSDAEHCACEPGIDRIIPASGPREACVTIQGECFRGTPAHPAILTPLLLTFNNTPNVPGNVTQADRTVSIGGTSIATTVPAAFGLCDPFTGNCPRAKVQITYNDPAYGTPESNEVEFYVDSNDVSTGPCLLSISPEEGEIGDDVVMRGSRLFDSENPHVQDVTFDDHSGTAVNYSIPNGSSWTDTRVNTSVPAGIHTAIGGVNNFVTVHNNNGTSNPVEFNALLPEPGRPYVRSKAPVCDSACRNALIWAKFNTAVGMDGASVTSHTTLNLCTNADCTTYGPVAGTIYTYNNGLQEVDVQPPTLAINQQYRVIITGDAQSIDGARLTRLDFDSDGNGTRDAYSWTFTTSDQICQVETVTVTPSPKTEVINRNINYTAVPRGPANSCDAGGEVLVPGAWGGWQSNDAARANVTVDNNNRAVVHTNLSTIPATPVRITQSADGVTGTGLLTITDCNTDDDCQSRCTAAGFPGNHSICMTSGPNAGQCTPWVGNISPDNGPSGQSVTVNGCNFGSFDKTSSYVSFAGVEKGVFKCDNAWTNNRIIVTYNATADTTVDPPSFDTGPKVVEVRTRYGLSNIDDSGQKENGPGIPPDPPYPAIQFNLTDTCNGVRVPDSGVPGICPIDRPLSGLIGKDIIINGYNFLPLAPNPPTSGVYYPGGVQDMYPAKAWDTGKVTSTIPVGATSGNDLYVQVNGCRSNGVEFRVACKVNTDCGSNCCRGGLCQPDNSQCLNGGAGQLCVFSDVEHAGATPPLCQVGVPLTDANNYRCIDTAGHRQPNSPAGQAYPPAATGDCRACCYPGQKNSRGLTCTPGEAPCTGAERGLYCGCANDFECGDSNTLGCSEGAKNCCYSRPQILSHHNSLCRNTVASVDFNQTMLRASVNSKTAFMLREMAGQRWGMVFDPPTGAAITAFGEFKGVLYFGTDTNTLYWTPDEENLNPITLNGILHEYSMITYHDRLYVGGTDTIFSFDDSSSSYDPTYPAGWDRTMVNGNPLSMVMFQDKIFAGTSRGTIRNFTVDPASASKLVEGTAYDTGDAAIQFNTLKVFNNAVYAGASDGRVYSSTDGTSWTPADVPGSNGVASLEVYDNALYAGAIGLLTGAQLYKLENNAWTLVHPFMSRVASLRQYRDRLYVGLGNGLIYLFDGNEWIMDGSVPTSTNAMFEYNKSLYAGSGNSARIYRMTIVPANVGLVTTEAGQQAVIRPTSVLAAGADYRVIVRGDGDNPDDNIHVGVQSSHTVSITQGLAYDYDGSGIADSYSWLFTTGDNICKLDNLEFEVSKVQQDPPPPHGILTSPPDFFLCAGLDTCPDDIAPGVGTPGNQHGYRIVAFDQSQNELTMAEATYAWSKSDSQNVIQMDDVAGVDDNKVITANKKNGTAYVTAKVTAYGVTKSATARISVNICDRPWPDYYAGAHFPYEDSFSHRQPEPTGTTYTNFSTSFCRDEGNLPTINATIVKDGPAAVGNGKKQELIKEFFFLFEAGAPNANDAVGIRVMENEDGLAPAEWYRNQFGPAAPEPQSLTVDGYQAVRAGRTVYVAATNLICASDALGAPVDCLVGPVVGGVQYKNIYLISYNEGAKDETVQIYDRLLNNWQFNINMTQVDRELMWRDMQRLNDLNNIYKKLLSYKDKNGHFPLLAGGSYIGGMTMSKWPSWQDTLGQGTGGNLPVDPVNTIAWPDPTDDLCLAANGYDQSTCWNATARRYQLPGNSHVYQYMVGPNGDSANLFTRMEYAGPGSLINFGAADLGYPPCSGQAECPTVFNYQFDITGTAQDHDGPINITTVNEVTGFPLAPVPPLIGTAQLTVTADDAGSPATGVAKVEFYVDGTRQFSDTDGSDGWRWTVDTRRFADRIAPAYYTFMVTVYDIAGNRSSRSYTVHISNTNGGSDTTPPFVRITSHTDGQHVTGNPIYVTAIGSDNVQLASLVVEVVGGPSQTCNLATPPVSPCTLTWDTTAINNGPYTIRATARDSSGLDSQTSIAAQLDNGDTQAPTAVTIGDIPGACADGTCSVGGAVCNVRNTCANGSTCNHAACNQNNETTACNIAGNISACQRSGAVTVSATANDNQGVTRMVFSLDSQTAYTDSNGVDGWSWPWDTTLAANEQAHTIRAYAYDAYNNNAFAEVANIFTFNESADHERPTVSFVESDAARHPAGYNPPPAYTPDNYAQVNSGFTITAEAKDNVHVAHVDFYFDYIYRYSDTVAELPPQVPDIYAWTIPDTFINSLSSGCHTFSVESVDTNNNHSLSKTQYIGVRAPCVPGFGQGPLITEADVTPNWIPTPPPPAVVTIQARVVDPDGVATVVAYVQSPDGTDITPPSPLRLYDDGTHGDLTAGNNIYTNTWTPPAPPPALYYVDIVATDNQGYQTRQENI